MTQMKENRGGARAGAGRPKGKRKSSEISADIKNDIFKALKEKYESGSKSFGELLTDLAYTNAKSVAPSLKITALKIIADCLTLKESANTVDVGKAVVILPEILRPEENE